MRISNEYIKNELGEMRRVSNDLNIPIEEIVRAFKSSVEVTLSNDIWGRLENTDSYDFKVGDWGALRDMAMRYKKTSPEELKKVMESGNYDRPLILKFGNRFHLVAGNTRLSTARVMGMSPKVFIGNIEMGKMGDSKIKIGEIYNEVLDEGNRGEYITFPNIDNDISLEVYETDDRIELLSIIIPKGLRGEGRGSEIMRMLCRYADERNKPIYLTPDLNFGATSINRLKGFYKRFGFVKNKNYEVSHSMVREPNR